MSKKQQAKKFTNTVINPAIERFERMFKEIDIQPNENGGNVKEKYPDWIVSGTNSASMKKFI